MTLLEKVHEEFREAADLATNSLPVIDKYLVQLAQETASRIVVGGKILLMGNGGSAADAQHIAGEFVVKLNVERAALPAVALTTDASVMTAAANDYGYAEVFARQVEAVCNVNDLVVALSTSGNSPNVVRGLETARERRVVTAAFLGADGGEAARHADIPIIIPSHNPQRIQELHAMMGHVWVLLVEELVFRGAR
ncbi:MAG: SIS domain-containing protein [Candidatus Coatesbacteria bacterium]|nr:MAG: SIS domain-containing protein [Candidatus Coatesbacteria bacterium]